MRRLAALLSLALVAGVLAAQAVAADPSDEPVQHLCPGNPPRQTSDPLSPPCVPVYDGDNGGSTAPGVTGDEIRLLVVLEGGINHVSASNPLNRVSPRGEIYDLGDDEQTCRQRGGGSGCSHLTVRGLRTWQRYFNERFQTYGRHVRFYAAFTSERSSGALAADAASHIADVDPFAVVPLFREGFDAYTDAVRERGRIVFADHGLLSEATLGDDLLWDFRPSVDLHATNFGALVCRQVVGRPPFFQTPTPRAVMGSVAEAAGRAPEPRRIGLLSTRTPEAPHLEVAADVVRAAIVGCGGEIVAEASHRHCCVARDNSVVPVGAAVDMARFVDAGVTTIVWTGGYTSTYTDAASAMGFRPEWVLLGDEMLGNSMAAFYGATAPQFHDRAVVLEPQLPDPDDGTPSNCWQRFREVDAETPQSDLGYVCRYYQPVFLAFLAFQTSGPTLTNANVGTGLAAIPVRSGSGFGDGHTLLRGGHLNRYDATVVRRDQRSTGCWRLASDRFEPHEWPDTDIFDTQRGACDRRDDPVRIDLL